MTHYFIKAKDREYVSQFSVKTSKRRGIETIICFDDKEKALAFAHWADAQNFLSGIQVAYSKANDWLVVSEQE